MGVTYGIVHRSSLTRKAEYKRQQDEYAFKEELIKEAKAEYQKKKNSGSGSSMFGLRERLMVAEINWEDAKSIEEALNRLG